jgi:hypothetical protein
MNGDQPDGAPISGPNVSPGPLDDNQKEGSLVLPKVPLTRWAVFAISLIAVAYSGISYGAKGYEQVKTVFASHDDSSAYTAAIIKEMEAHKGDGSGIVTKLHTDTGGDTVAVYYQSDGCIAIARPGKAPSAYLPAQSSYEWSLGPSRRPAGKPPQPPQSLNGSWQEIKPSASVLADATAHSPAAISKEPLVRSSGVPGTPTPQGTCLNPHPGQWQGSWGPANGCWAPFYRRFYDGCIHYQMYNACQGIWDPEIHWTYCARH